MKVLKLSSFRNLFLLYKTHCYINLYTYICMYCIVYTHTYFIHLNYQIIFATDKFYYRIIIRVKLSMQTIKGRGIYYSFRKHFLMGHMFWKYVQIKVSHIYLHNRVQMKVRSSSMKKQQNKQFLLNTFSNCTIQTKFSTFYP